jgi:transposase
MNHAREILRLSRERKMSGRAIAQSLSLSPSTISKYLRQLEPVPWPLPDSGGEALLAKVLEKKKAPAPSARVEPDWAQVHRELQSHKGVTLLLLWEEYRETAKEQGYSYSRFCIHYAAYAKRLKPSFRNTYTPGDRLFIDYAGTTVPIRDPKTGEVALDAQVFVSVLGFSNYVFSEATSSQELSCWIGSHVRCFAFLGGVPALLVPDNLKSGITTPDLYEPLANETYREMAEHYSVAIFPARVKRPRDKAPAEQSVLLVTRWILAKLRKRTFFDLAELNRAIRILLEELNTRPFKDGRPGSRKDLFLSREKAALGPLPSTRYELARWKKAKVHIDYHVEVDRHFYSVPHALIHQEVRIRITETVVEVFHHGERVASHKKDPAPGRHTTLSAHMPESHQAVSGWSPERFLEWAGRVGSATRQVVEALLSSRRHPQQAYRSCLGLLSLARKDSPSTLEHACQRALALGVGSYREVRVLMESTSSRKTSADAPNSHPVQTHDNIRGARYYAALDTKGEPPC